MSWVALGAQKEIEQLSSFGLLHFRAEEIAKPTLQQVKARQEVNTPSGDVEL